MSSHVVVFEMCNNRVGFSPRLRELTAKRDDVHLVLAAASTI
jgi:hypothetical protein